jgi:tRNA C32,U32 (ribose-2'-O)-methylase TrmJ
MSKKNLLLTKIEAAKHHVSAAEAELDKLMAEIRAEPRAHKTTVSEVMQSTFDKLRAAKSDVAALEKLLLTEED